ncbi:hypothetical protein V520_06130 [Pseudomonas putida KG-4]|nr:hypothetical protein V520_06130 [Pseudomonas putida KG-4]
MLLSLMESDSETAVVGMDGPRSEAGKKAGFKSHPFAGMIRIRFEGSPRCSVQRFLSPLPGSPWWRSGIPQGAAAVTTQSGGNG